MSDPNPLENLGAARSSVERSIPTPPAPIKTPRLRSSCDGCGTAKVKCDRVRPKCGRCATLSSTCIYGISQKSGKPPRKRPGSYLDTPTEKRICSPLILTADSCDNHTAINFEDPQIVNEPTEANTASAIDDTFPMPDDINEQNQVTSDFYPSMSFEDWSQFDSFGDGFQILPNSALELTGTLGLSYVNPKSHSCPRESYEIFRDLICPSPSLHAPKSNSVTVSAQLDQVLHFNRDAIERLTRVLKCPCAKTGHRAMVHASIVSRILIWYQQAAGWTGSSSWGPRPSEMTSSSTSSSSSPSPSPPPSGIAASTTTTSPPSLVQATGFAVQHVPLSIGTFSIEDQQIQAAFRNQLVLCELKRAANLIDMFFVQDSDESSANCVAGLYSHLGTWLRSEHSRTIKTLKSRLVALNENLGS